MLALLQGPKAPTASARIRKFKGDRFIFFMLHPILPLTHPSPRTRREGRVSVLRQVQDERKA